MLAEIGVNDMKFGKDGDLYVIDRNEYVIKKISAEGFILHSDTGEWHLILYL